MYELGQLWPSSSIVKPSVDETISRLRFIVGTLWTIIQAAEGFEELPVAKEVCMCSVVIHLT